MNADQGHQAGLSRVHDRIVALLDELDWTVESAERLAQVGRPELALRIVQDQERSLDLFVESVAQDIGTGPRKPLERVHRRGLAVAMITIVAVLALGAAAFAVTHNPRPPLGALATQLTRAEHLANPVARLASIERVYAHTKDRAGARALNARVARDARKTHDELRDAHANEDLVARADRIAREANPPTPPHSSDQTPLDTVKDTLSRT